jgi:hypothetical protein
MEPFATRVRDCACPGTPHEEGDVVYLNPTLSLDGGIAAEQDIVKAAGDSDLLVRSWVKTFLTHEAIGWNLVDEDGPRPFSVDDLLADYALARPAADAAVDRYGDTVLGPLLARLAGRSPTGRTTGTTSRTRPRTRKSPVSP